MTGCLPKTGPTDRRVACDLGRASGTSSTPASCAQPAHPRRPLPSSTSCAHHTKAPSRRFSWWSRPGRTQCTHSSTPRRNSHCQYPMHSRPLRTPRSNERHPHLVRLRRRPASRRRHASDNNPLSRRRGSPVLGIIPPSNTRCTSWHRPTRRFSRDTSWRIYIAFTLRASGADGDIIQALLRWRSASSLHIYARLNPGVFSLWLLRITNTEKNFVQTMCLSDLSPGGVVATLDPLAQLLPRSTFSEPNTHSALHCETPGPAQHSGQFAHIETQWFRARNLESPSSPPLFFF